MVRRVGCARRSGNAAAVAGRANGMGEAGASTANMPARSAVLCVAGKRPAEVVARMTLDAAGIPWCGAAKGGEASFAGGLLCLVHRLVCGSRFRLRKAPREDHQSTKHHGRREPSVETIHEFLVLRRARADPPAMPHARQPSPHRALRPHYISFGLHWRPWNWMSRMVFYRTRECPAHDKRGVVRDATSIVNQLALRRDELPQHMRAGVFAAVASFKSASNLLLTPAREPPAP